MFYECMWNPHRGNLWEIKGGSLPHSHHPVAVPGPGPGSRQLASSPVQPKELECVWEVDLELYSSPGATAGVD